MKFKVTTNMTSDNEWPEVFIAQTVNNHFFFK